MTNEHIVYLGLGSNEGNRKECLEQACREIDKLIGSIKRRSACHETEPWGFDSPNKFLNAVVCCTTALSPMRLLRATQHIERMLGRRTKTGPDGTYHDRPIDIDILLYDDLHISTPQLVIPHPHMLERPFVMEPLREVMPQEKFRKLDDSDSNRE